MSTVKKSQKRDLPFQLYQPPVVDVDEEYDKENQPVSYESRFSRVVEPQTHECETMNDKRRATEPYRSVVADVDMDEEGSLTRQDSEYIQQLLASQTHSRKSSSSVNNRISDQDETHSFMTGRRDTADMRLLMGLQELIDKSNDAECCCLFNPIPAGHVNTSNRKVATTVLSPYVGCFSRCVISICV